MYRRRLKLVSDLIELLFYLPRLINDKLPDMPITSFFAEAPRIEQQSYISTETDIFCAEQKNTV